MTTQTYPWTKDLCSTACLAWQDCLWWTPGIKQGLFSTLRFMKAFTTNLRLRQGTSALSWMNWILSDQNSSKPNSGPWDQCSREIQMKGNPSATFTIRIGGKGISGWWGIGNGLCPNQSDTYSTWCSSRILAMTIPWFRIMYSIISMTIQYNLHDVVFMCNNDNTLRNKINLMHYSLVL